jgi:hypothetical protein
LDEWRLVVTELDADVELVSPVEKGHGRPHRWRRRTARWIRP